MLPKVLPGYMLTLALFQIAAAMKLESPYLNCMGTLTAFGLHNASPVLPELWRNRNNNKRRRSQSSSSRMSKISSQISLGSVACKQSLTKM
jgi:hypothetical protein